MSVPGAWSLHFDWGCGGNYATSPITFNANGTFALAPYTGKWTSHDGQIILRLDETNSLTLKGNGIGPGPKVNQITNLKAFRATAAFCCRCFLMNSHFFGSTIIDNPARSLSSTMRSAILSKECDGRQMCNSRLSVHVPLGWQPHVSATLQRCHSLTEMNMPAPTRSS